MVFVIGYKTFIEMNRLIGIHLYVRELAIACISYDNSVCPSVRPSVRHNPVPF